jgi:ATP-dependent helicase YprA (DUF1998 family)/very-short-patch-repair endonuclease
VDVFDLRNRVVGDYADYVRSFLTIRDERIANLVHQELQAGHLWPEPLIQLNPAFERGDAMEKLVANGALHAECLRIFRKKETPETDEGLLRLHRHQVESIHAARARQNYVLTTGTGSGKSLAYIVPIVDHVLRQGSGRGIQAIVVYPMNALANSQMGELRKFLCHGYPDGRPPVTFQRYTGQESDEKRKEIIANPPDILLTNYVMLELLLTRPWDRNLIRAARGLRFLVLDELHTYRGRQGADVAMLVRRVREACEARELLHVGTSATLAGGGTWREQQEEVAELASRLFGTPVRADRVIGETLRRVTPTRPEQDSTFVEQIRRRIARPAPETTEAFIADPLASWIESSFGLREDPASGRLVRARPQPLSGADGAAARLASLTAAAVDNCEAAIRDALLSGHRHRDENGQPLFAFRLHQFVSKGEAVYASPEVEGERHVTLLAQQFVPGSDRQRVLLPLAFCRECGQEYYVVRRGTDEGGRVRFVPREISDRLETDEGEPGYLHIDTTEPWPSARDELFKRLPDAWIEDRDGVLRVRDARRDRLPAQIFLSPAAVEGAGHLRAHFIPAPFLFCLHCRVAYDAHQTSDYGKLATLGSEGRSTATTILTLSAVRRLRGDETLAPQARKLLSFTDNRQDASLQAGHFNDFVEIALLRSALQRAVREAGAEGLRHDTLTAKVFDALALPLDLYAANPRVEYQQLDETQRALRRVLGYYLYRDLRRGWRITSANLEQCGLLRIDYQSLDRFCADQPKWAGRHAALANATPEQREAVSGVLLDYLRRELAIRVDYLEPVAQESILQLSTQYLVPPWSLDDQERMETSHVVYARSRGDERAGDRSVFLSARGGFGLHLKRAFPDFGQPLTLADVDQIIAELLEALTIPGLTHQVADPRPGGRVAGYQVNASAFVWRAGEGKQAFHDPIRVPSAPEEGLRANPFFAAFYRSDTRDLLALEAREHTAAVPSAVRQDREDAFRAARLPILYCSPTMELGVDIKQLNVVNLRNVPPTPANYAQRSGRAGRSGEPAFVLTYCSAGSSHDQYFFRRPDLMVSGAVATPRLDLANEDLLRAHVHAIWLGESGLALGQSLRDVLDVGGDEPSLELLPAVRDKLLNPDARARALGAARTAIGSAIEPVVGPDGSTDPWLRDVLDQIPRRFDAACDRWRGLYRAALAQSKRQAKIVRDASRDPRDREYAARLRNEAETQLRLLLETSDQGQSDFYSYRYFASEGFLPGYAFPRLPLSAYLPGRRRSQAQGRDDFLSRPRFLAISEFGPRAILYHEGSRYVINKAILPVGEDENLTRRAAQCAACGYLHPLGDEPTPDLCERCRARLPLPHDNLFRMQNVATRRRDRINSDEEERLRWGYEIRTGVRFEERGGARSERTATLRAAGGSELIRLSYGQAARLWRMNLGWRRRRNKEQKGYLLDLERGFWERSQETDDTDDPLSPNTKRVIPYVEDHRNCLLLEPIAALDQAAMASLQAGLKVAIQTEFQLEDGELSVEPLPDDGNRRLILIYEAAEGGAGVLRRLVEDSAALPRVARQALDVCHFDAAGADRRHAPGARENCEAACYDCLLSYYNQRDHGLLDRQLLPPILIPWLDATVATSPAPRPRRDHVESLARLAGSELERRWLTEVERLGLRLPIAAQQLVHDIRPDFLYDGVAIFIDGPPHDDPRQQAVDVAQRDRLEEQGWAVIRFHHAADWEPIFRRYPSVFGALGTDQDRDR